MGSDEKVKLIARTSAANTELEWGMRLVTKVLGLTSTTATEFFCVLGSIGSESSARGGGEAILRCL